MCFLSPEEGMAICPVASEAHATMEVFDHLVFPAPGAATRRFPFSVRLRGPRRLHRLVSLAAFGRTRRRTSASERLLRAAISTRVRLEARM